MTPGARMATLARLMNAGRSVSIDPGLLADAGECLSGDLAIDEMPRILELLSNAEGAVHYALRFTRDEYRRVLITGEFSTRLSMLCQRCLEPAEIDISHAVNLAVTGDETEADALPARLEPFLLTKRTVPLNELLEEELLLALPLAPNHDTETCHRQNEMTGEKADETQRPFADLKTLMAKNEID